MEVRSVRQRWTYSEFARVRSEGSERYEVLDGELVMTPAPTSNHQRVVMRLGSRLHVFAERHDLGTVLSSPIDVLFAEGDYFEPDIVFVRRNGKRFSRTAASRARPTWSSRCFLPRPPSATSA